MVYGLEQNGRQIDKTLMMMHSTSPFHLLLPSLVGLFLLSGQPCAVMAGETSTAAGSETEEYSMQRKKSVWLLSEEGILALNGTPVPAVPFGKSKGNPGRRTEDG